MEIEYWENNEEWGPLRDKVNQIIDAVNLSMPQIGSIIASPKSTAPTVRYRICEGQELSRTDYAELFDIIGTTYGDGDGSDTFNLPDLRGKTIYGLKDDDADFDTLGANGGAKEVTLTSEQSGLRGHSHNVGGYAEGGGAIANIMKASGTNLGLETGDVINTDGEPSRDGAQDALEAHNNLPPYVVFNWIMRVL